MNVTMTEIGWLSWHWPCYLITRSNGRYRAERRDDHSAVWADSAAELLGKIRDDYLIRPISREVCP